MIEELLGPERRRRRSPQEKIAIVQETLQPGMTVCKRQVTAACDSSPGIASLELRLI